MRLSSISVSTKYTMKWLLPIAFADVSTAALYRHLHSYCFCCCCRYSYWATVLRRLLCWCLEKIFFVSDWNLVRKKNRNISLEHKVGTAQTTMPAMHVYEVNDRLGTPMPPAVAATTMLYRCLRECFETVYHQNSYYAGSIRCLSANLTLRRITFPSTSLLPALLSQTLSSANTLYVICHPHAIHCSFIVPRPTLFCSVLAVLITFLCVTCLLYRYDEEWIRSHSPLYQYKRVTHASRWTLESALNPNMKYLPAVIINNSNPTTRCAY